MDLQLAILFILICFCKNNQNFIIYAKLLRNKNITLHYQNEKTNGI